MSFHRKFNLGALVFAGPALLFLGCATPGQRAGARSDKGATVEAVKFTPRDFWTLESPPRGTDNALEADWRTRRAQWAGGTLANYPFEPPGQLPVAEQIEVGKPDSRGNLVTQMPQKYPEHSVHETEPWGDPGAVWPIRNRWSAEWERRYSDWVTSTVTSEFLATYEISVDCADAPYAVRWIFSRIHYLPAGGHSVAGAAFGNWNTRFADLPTAEEWSQDQRFMAALRYMLKDYIQGRSIPYDTYPIALSPNAGALRPGTVVADRAHVRIIHKIDPGSYRPVRHLSATLPAKVRWLADEALSDATPNDGPGWGIVNWSWWEYDFNLHRYRTVPDWKMPGFSTEQYSKYDLEINAGLIQQTYQNATMRTSPPDPVLMIRELAADAHESLRVRADVVAEGSAYYEANPRDRDKTTRQYDDFSTPARDKRIMAKLDEIWAYVRGNGISSRLLDEEMARYRVNIGDGRAVSLQMFFDAMRSGRVSSEPWDSLDRRWGIGPSGALPAVVVGPSPAASTVPATATRPAPGASATIPLTVAPAPAIVRPQSTPPQSRTAPPGQSAYSPQAANAEREASGFVFAP